MAAPRGSSFVFALAMTACQAFIDGSGAGTTGGHPTRGGIREDAVTPDAPFRLTAPAASAAPSFAMPKVREKRLANGLQLLLVENHELPMVAISVAMRRGAGATRPGLAHLARNMLNDGTEVRDNKHLTQTLHTIGAQETGSTSQSWNQLEYLVLPSGAEEMVGLIAEMLRRPDPRESVFENTRNWWLAQARAQSPDERLDEAVAAALYPVGHPYRAPTSGTVESLKAFRKADAVAFLREHVTPDQLVIAAAGDMTWSTFSERVEAEFGDWRAKAIPALSLPAIVAPSTDAPILIVDRPGVVQAEVRIAALCPPRDSPDLVAFQLLADALGGNFTSRILLNLREGHGYSYTPHTTVALQRGPGIFAAVARVPIGRVGESLAEMMHELDRVGAEDIPTAELALAKTALVQTFQGVFSTRATTASTLSLLLAHERPADDYAEASRLAAAMKPSDVRAVAQRYLAPRQRRIVIMGEAKAIRNQLAGQRIEIWPLKAE